MNFSAIMELLSFGIRQAGNIAFSK